MENSENPSGEWKEPGDSWDGGVDLAGRAVDFCRPLGVHALTSSSAESQDVPEAADQKPPGLAPFTQRPKVLSGGNLACLVPGKLVAQGGSWAVHAQSQVHVLPGRSHVPWGQPLQRGCLGPRPPCASQVCVPRRVRRDAPTGVVLTGPPPLTLVSGRNGGGGTRETPGCSPLTHSLELGARRAVEHTARTRWGYLLAQEAAGPDALRGRW